MILIIGSEGFIGSHLVDYYSYAGKKVIVCHTNPNKNNNINSFYVEKLNPDFDSIFKGKEINFCINASGSKGVGFSIDNPEEDYILNVLKSYCLRILSRMRMFAAGIYLKFSELSTTESSMR